MFEKKSETNPFSKYRLYKTLSETLKDFEPIPLGEPFEEPQVLTVILLGAGITFLTFVLVVTGSAPWPLFAWAAGICFGMTTLLVCMSQLAKLAKQILRREPEIQSLKIICDILTSLLQRQIDNMMKIDDLTTIVNHLKVEMNQMQKTKLKEQKKPE